MPTRRVYAILRNDDPCALSGVDRERRVLSLFAKHGVPHVTAVVPRMVTDPHDDRGGTYFPLHENPDMLSLLREYQAKGGLLEIAQHGETHQTHRLRPSASYERGLPDAFAGIAGPWLPFRPTHPEGYSEFSGLPLAEQREKVLRGKAYLEQLFDTKLHTFVFPWNTADAHSLRAVREAGFRYVLGGEDDVPGQRGLLVLGACFWWDPSEDHFSRVVDDALTQRHSTLLHLSFHSWMFKEPDIERLDAFLRRFSGHPEVVFITPSELPKLGQPVRKYVQLRRAITALHPQVARRVWVFDREEKLYYVLSLSHYLRKLHFYALAAMIFRTLGLTGWLVAAALIALVTGYGLVRTWNASPMAAGLSGLAMLAAVFIFEHAWRLRKMRRRQHQLEGAGS